MQQLIIAIILLALDRRPPRRDIWLALQSFLFSALGARFFAARAGCTFSLNRNALPLNQRAELRGEWFSLNSFFLIFLLLHEWLRHAHHLIGNPVSFLLEAIPRLIDLELGLYHTSDCAIADGLVKLQQGMEG